MSRIGIIGDVHGNFNEYFNLIRREKLDYSIQLGDFGFKYPEIDQGHHIIPGNHDDYSRLPSYSLGDFGIREVGGFKFFFIRGASSVDYRSRGYFVDVWPNEELNYFESLKCLDLYEAEKPDFVLSHDCPQSILWNDYPPSFTRKLLQELFEIHQPKAWCFGHHHVNKKISRDGTIFNCVDVLNCLVVEDLMNELSL